jgi:glucose-6-phosphate 1-epimerase
MTQSNLDALNHQFGIPNVVAVIAGNGGLPKVRVTTPAASAEIYLHGAHVTSWQPAGEKEVLFVSEKSHWEDGKPIRGGIPICFPWFRAKVDDPKAPSHGFVRTKEWRLESIKQENESVMVVCSTASDESTRKWWPHDFRAVHTISIGRSLRLQLRVTNTGDAPFHFEEALHTYFRVSEAAKVRVRGLNGIAYLDNVDGNKEKTQSGDIVFAAKTDNAYIDVLGPAEIVDEEWRRVLRTEKEHSATTVVWNSAADGAASIADLGNDEWRQFACVEASNILSRSISLAPGEEHTMQSLISVVPQGNAR